MMIQNKQLILIESDEKILRFLIHSTFYNSTQNGNCVCVFLWFGRKRNITKEKTKTKVDKLKLVHS